MTIRRWGFGHWLLTAALLAVALLCALAPRSAEAHAAFDRSDPQPNTVLAESPGEIRIWFTEPLEDGYSEVRLFDETGHEIPDLIVEKGEGTKSLVVPLPVELANGTYSVVWENLSSADGHPAQGYFAFTVGTEADVASVTAPVIEDSGGAPIWLQALSRWLVLLAMAVAVAVWPVWLLVLWPAVSHRRARSDLQQDTEVLHYTSTAAQDRDVLHYTGEAPQDPEVRHDSGGSYRRDAELARELSGRARKLGIGAVVAALIANLLALAVQATYLESGSLVSRIGDTLSDTRYGRLWLARVGLLALMALALWLAPWLDPLKKRVATAAALIMAALLPLPVSMNAHASALDQGRTTAIAFDYVHLLTASLWFGGLVLLAGVLLRTLRSQVDRRVVLSQALPRFSAMALVCWGLLAVTGLYAWWLQVGSWEALRETQYGQSLLVKLIVAAVVLLIAATNLLLITRKLAQTDPKTSPKWFGRLGYAVVAELVLTTLILLAVGRMTSLQPARDVLAAESAGQTISFDLDGRDATLKLDPGAAGMNHFLVTISGDPVPDGTETLLRLTFAGEQIGTKELTLDRASPATFETHGSELGIAGDWEIELLVRKIGEFEWTDTQSIALGATGTAAAKPPWRFGAGGLVGLLLLGIAFIGFVVAWRAGKSRLRMESVGLGAVAALLGLMLMAQARIQPATGSELGLENPVAASSDSVTRGAALYQANCLACHGATGQGDGPAGAELFPKPADFTASHTQAHPDGQLFSWIQNGKAGTGMPAFGELTDEQIWDLINSIQVEFQDKPVEGGRLLRVNEAVG